MNKPANQFKTQGRAQDSEFARLVDQLTSDLLLGNPVNVEKLCSEHPGYAQPLLALLPAIETMANLSEHTANLTAFETGTPDGNRAIGDYRIHSEIGRGGMGVVYKAEQVSLGRTVALKVLPFTGLLDERQLQRFKKEARAAASLRHPNIVSVHEVGADGAIHYYAMDLIEGTDLASAIRTIHSEQTKTSKLANGSKDTQSLVALSTRRGEHRRDFYRAVARLGLQAADAVQYAHSEGIVHRDIKPANLLLDNDGVIHVTDFGLAHVQTEDELTLTGDLIGTIRYMSPEQVEGNKFVDPRSDVYSLGLSLYELLAGQPAIEGASRADLLRRITDGSPTPLRSMAADIPPDLETIVETAIASNPEDRYQSAIDFRDDLQAFLDIREIRAKPSTQLDRLRRFAKRNPALTATFAAVFVLLSLLTGTSTLLAINFARQASFEATQLAVEQQQLVESKKRERIQRLGLYSGDMRTAQTFAKERSYFELQETLLKWVPANGEEDFRSFEWFHLWALVDNPAFLHAFNHELPTSRVCFVNNEEVVSTGFANRANRLSLDANQSSEPLAYYLTPNTNIEGLCFDGPRDRVFLGDCGGTVCAYSTNTNELITRLFLQVDQGEGAIRMLNVSPNGKWLAVSSGDSSFGQVAVIEIDSGERILKLDLPGRGRAGFGPRNELIVASRRQDFMRIFDTDTWSEAESIPLAADGVMGFALSEDRSLLALSLTIGAANDWHDSRIEVWRASDWQKLATFKTNHPAKGLAFRPDNQQLAWADYGGQISFAKLGVAPRQTFRRKLQTGAIYCVAYSPDGSRIVTAGSNALASVWDVEKLTTYNFGTIQRRGLPVGGIGWIDDSQFAIGHRGIGVTYVRADTGESIGRIEHPPRNENFYALQSAPETGQIVLNELRWPRPEDTSATSEVMLWDSSGKLDWRTELAALGTSWTSSTLTPNGRFYCGCSHHHGLIIVDLEQKRIAKRFPDLYSKTIHCSADSSTLVVGRLLDEDQVKAGQARGIAVVIDLSTHEIQDEIVMDQRLIDCVTISPDGKLMAAVGFEFQLKIYDRMTNTLRAARRLLPGFPNCVRFSPDNKRLMTASLDGKLIMWVTETGEQIQTWDVRPFDWKTFEFSRRGDILAAGGLTELHILHAPSSNATRGLSASQLRSRACQNISRISW